MVEKKANLTVKKVDASDIMLSTTLPQQKITIKKSSFKKVGELKPPKQVTVNIQLSADEPPAQETNPKSPNAAAQAAKEDSKKGAASASGTGDRKPLTAEEKRAQREAANAAKAAKKAAAAAKKAQ